VYAPVTGAEFELIGSAAVQLLLAGLGLSFEKGLPRLKYACRFMGPSQRVDPVSQLRLLAGKLRDGCDGDDALTEEAIAGLNM
jgi:hypothetical protein